MEVFHYSPSPTDEFTRDKTMAELDVLRRQYPFGEVRKWKPTRSEIDHQLQEKKSYFWLRQRPTKEELEALGLGDRWVDPVKRRRELALAREQEAELASLPPPTPATARRRRRRSSAHDSGFKRVKKASASTVRPAVDLEFARAYSTPKWRQLPSTTKPVGGTLPTMRCRQPLRMGSR